MKFLQKDLHLLFIGILLGFIIFTAASLISNYESTSIDKFIANDCIAIVDEFDRTTNTRRIIKVGKELYLYRLFEYLGTYTSEISFMNRHYTKVNNKHCVKRGI